jgi:hypothetical protein
MDQAGLTFRATKDLDIVLCVEAIDARFGSAFWSFVNDGGYESRERSTGERQFYRFQKPTEADFPYMLELFARAPMEEEVSSLSAILMNDEYYTFLQDGKRNVDGLQIAGAEHLIPLKARAWLDLKEREDRGDRIDSKEIKKHKNDVFRLSGIVDRDQVGVIPQVVQNDLTRFLTDAEAEGVDLKSLGIRNLTFDEVASELRSIYGLN